MAISRHPFSSYSGYQGSGVNHGGSSPDGLPSDYPVKQKEHTSAQHLDALHKYVESKRAEHREQGKVWWTPESVSKDIAVHTALAQMERVFPKKS